MASERASQRTFFGISSPPAHRRAFYVAGEMRVERVMKDELVTILEAMRAAQSELAAYLVSTGRNAELTIAKLVGILDRREVVRAMRLLRPLHRPGNISRGELIPHESQFPRMSHEKPRLETTLAGV
jgi:hypothetical protein